MPEAGSISIATKAQNNSVFLIVKDSGPGIPPEIQSKIFDPFFTTKPDGSGTGLGLSTSKSIVERFGGKIDFTSSKEQGTSFVISFTAEEVAR